MPRCWKLLLLPQGPGVLPGPSSFANCPHKEPVQRPLLQGTLVVQHRRQRRLGSHGSSGGRGADGQRGLVPSTSRAGGAPPRGSGLPAGSPEWVHSYITWSLLPPDKGSGQDVRALPHAPALPPTAAPLSRPVPGRPRYQHAQSPQSLLVHQPASPRLKRQLFCLIRVNKHRESNK